MYVYITFEIILLRVTLYNIHVLFNMDSYGELTTAFSLNSYYAKIRDHS